MVKNWQRQALPPRKAAPALLNRRRTLFDAFLAGVCFVGVQVGLQWLLYARQEDGAIHWLTAMFSASMVAVLVYMLREHTRKRRLANHRRFEAIAEANHHVRNALEAMQARFYLMKTDPEHTTGLLESVNRIQWVLKEVLPDVND